MSIFDDPIHDQNGKLIENHDLTQLRGVVDTLVDGNEGLEFEATLADTRASRDAVGSCDLSHGRGRETRVLTNPVEKLTLAGGQGRSGCCGWSRLPATPPGKRPEPC